MSGAARRRGRGRPKTNDEASEPSSSQRGRGAGLRAPGQFDGPASRGSASGAGSQSRGGSNAPSAGSQGGTSTAQPQHGSQPSSRRESVSGITSGIAQMNVDPARDPENVPRYTDQLRNVDLPATFYNIDALVSHSPSNPFTGLLL